MNMIKTCILTRCISGKTCTEYIRRWLPIVQDKSDHMGFGLSHYLISRRPVCPLTLSVFRTITHEAAHSVFKALINPLDAAHLRD